MTMRPHDECWWKHGRSQTLCRNNMHPWALKPSHTMKACVFSNHVKFRRIWAQVKGISTLAPFIAQRMTSVDNGIGDRLVNWKVFHDISREFWQWFHWWEWGMMTIRLHDECWWKRGRSSQRLCGHDIYYQALKPSHSVKTCVLSNHVKFRSIHGQVEGMSTLSPFTAQHAASVDNGIGDGLVNWKMFHEISREFRQRFHWWEWKKMTMRLHDECWWKCGWSQTLWGHGMHP